MYHPAKVGMFGTVQIVILALFRAVIISMFRGGIYKLFIFDLDILKITSVRLRSCGGALGPVFGILLS